MTDLDLDTVSREVRTGKRDPGTVDVKAVAAALEASDRSRRRAAGKLLASIAKRSPESAARVTSELAAALYDSDFTVRNYSAQAIAHVTAVAPEELRDDVPQLAGALTDDSMLVQRHLGMALGNVADDDPATVAPHVESLRPLFEHETREVVGYATAAVEAVTEADPAAALPAIGPLLQRIDDPVDIETPDSATDVVSRGDARELDVEAEREDIKARKRQTAITRVGLGVIAKLSADDPDAVLSQAGDDVTALINLLDHWDPEIRGTAAGILGYLGTVRPDLLEPASDRLRELLADEKREVRGNALYAVASLGDEASRKAIERFVDSEGSAQLRATAEAILEDL